MPTWSSIFSRSPDATSPASVYCDFAESGPFVTLLPNLPNIHHLKISYLGMLDGDYPDVFETLRLGDGARNLVPNLQELTLDTYNTCIFNPDDFPELPSDLFKSIIPSRLGRLCRLTLLQKLDEISECVKILMNTGLDVVVDWDGTMEDSCNYSDEKK
ncbi:uncharacterized protein BT62DRAFT_688383 [Guyanagaster necrorhizus]|uniref:Uncharacterized protein n=1 Tax=Guyanagaster necrorhizus TaxID=856835 RepID=A0A9P7VF49_9AGAR|nr:uncharacterized protein BT62DRAFT_688383 [Guyanagaster necrorhizus MCA 3950]KAG7439801.1 hypothetical protein BT62DRAFT_688383 [Guyanagaster necrorhizus MCA 3950]